jgi:hypothetical protein
VAAIWGGRPGVIFGSGRFDGGRFCGADNGETAEVGMIGREGVVGAISSAGKLSGPDQLLYSIGGNSSKDSHAGLSSCLSIIGGRYGNAFWSVRSSNLTVSVKSQAATVYMKQRQGWRAGS